MHSLTISHDNAVQMMPIQIFYASTSEVTSFEAQVPVGSTIMQVLELTQSHPIYKQIIGFDINSNLIGIFGKIKSKDTVVQKGDRLEIYRPLIANPMDARRRRANKPSKINVKV